jgi:hypothetical protein
MWHSAPLVERQASSRRGNEAAAESETVHCQRYRRRVAAVNCTGVRRPKEIVDSDKIYRLVEGQESMTLRNRVC